MQKDFYQIQQKIDEFLNSIGKDENFTKTFGKLSTNDALFCAGDIIRNKAFFQAIKEALNDIKKEEKIIVDAGSGTGILGFFALFLGAQKCIFIEANEISLEISKNLAKYLGFYEKCTFYKDDATKIILKENYNLIISETIDSGFGSEEFPFIIKNLYRENVKIIPEKFIFHINSSDENGNFLETQELEVLSENIFGNNKIFVNRETKKIEITSKIFLYNNIFINSGDCISFANKRISDLKNEHKFLKILKK